MTIDLKHFRRLLGHFATGVTIITGAKDAEMFGLTVNSFNSVSLDPPLISFCAAKSSSSWPALSQCTSLGVNILGNHQETMARTFACSGRNKFEGVEYELSTLGSPQLKGAVASFECVPFDEFPAGDHSVVFLRVTDMLLNEEPHSPLVFFSGGFHSLSKIEITN